MRRQAVTVRLPRASSAPINSSLTCSQTGLVNRGAKATIKFSKSAGSMGIGKTSFGEVVFLSLIGLPLLFQRAKMDKVEHGSSVLIRLIRVYPCSILAIYR